MASQATHHDINALLKRVDVDVKELVKVLGSPGSTDGKTGALQTRLQEHREAIRKRISKGGLPAGVQGQLAAVRTRVESQLRKLKDACQHHGCDRKAQELAPAQSNQTIRQASPQDRQQNQGLSSPQLQTQALHSDGAQVIDAEPKILVEQLVDEGNTSEFVCQICQTHIVGRGPKLTSCSHLFCGDCIAKWHSIQKSSVSWASRAQQAGSVPCPVCKESIRPDGDLHLVCPEGEGGSGMLWQIISATPVVCANHPRCNPNGQCNWKGTYGTYQEHIRSCTNTPLNEFMESEATSLAAEETSPTPIDDALGEMADEQAHVEAVQLQEEVIPVDSWEQMDKGCEQDHTAVEEEGVHELQACGPAFDFDKDESDENSGEEGEAQLGLKNCEDVFGGPCGETVGDATTEDSDLTSMRAGDEQTEEAELTDLIQQLFNEKLKLQSSESSGVDSNTFPKATETIEGSDLHVGNPAQSPLEAISEHAVPLPVPVVQTTQGSVKEGKKGKKNKIQAASLQHQAFIAQAQAAWAAQARSYEAQAQYYSQWHYHQQQYQAQVAQWQRVQAASAAQRQTCPSAALAAQR